MEKFSVFFNRLVFVMIFLLKTQIGGSNKYPQSMFLSRNKKNNVYPCKPHLYYIKVVFKGSKLYRYVFVMHSVVSNDSVSGH